METSGVGAGENKREGLIRVGEGEFHLGIEERDED